VHKRSVVAKKQKKTKAKKHISHRHVVIGHVKRSLSRELLASFKPPMTKTSLLLLLIHLPLCSFSAFDAEFGRAKNPGTVELTLRCGANASATSSTDTLTVL